MAAPFDKRKALQNALAYTQQGKWDRAITEYQAILKADPRDLTVCNNLGDLYARANKNVEAIEQYLKLGELYRADGLSVKAIAVYKKIAKLDPAHTGAYRVCAELYWEQGLVGEAKTQMAMVVEQCAKAGDTPQLIEAYQKLIQYDPGNVPIIARLADLLAKGGRTEAAAAEYDRAAQAAQAAGQAAESKRYYAKARELAPAAAEASVGTAEMLVSDGKYAEAAEMLAGITAAESGNVDAWRLLGEAERLQGKPEAAVRALQQAISLGVAEQAVARPLGAALLALGQADEAVALCQRLIDEGLAIGDPDSAIGLIQGLLTDAPQAIPLHLQLTTMLMNLGRDVEAQAALWGLARAHEAAGDSEAAVGVFRQLVDRDPADTEAHARLTALTAGTGGAPQVEWSSLASEAAPELVLAEPEELPATPAADPEFQIVAAPAAEEVASPFAPSTFGGGDLAMEPAPVVEIGLEPGAAETSADPFSAFADLGLGSEEEAKQLLFDEPAEAGADAGGAFALTLDTEPEAVSFPAGDAGGGWAGEEIPTLELEEVSADEPVAIEIPAEIPVEAAAVESTSLSDLGADETGALGYSVAALSRRIEAGSIGLGVIGDAGDDGDDESASRVAEQLAEAEVYLKYGLEEKARERLLDAVRQEPEAVGARRKLKAFYLQREQREDAVAEMLSIARILEKRGRVEAARREIQEGVALEPGHPELQAYEVGESVAAAAPVLLDGGLEPVLEMIPAPDAVAPLPEMEIFLPPTEEEPAAGSLAAAIPAPDAVAPLPEMEIFLPPTEEEPAAGSLAAAIPAPDAVAPLPEIPLPLDEEEPAPALPAAESAEPLDEMPEELRALMDEAATEGQIEILAAGGSDEPFMVDDLAEAEFYLGQGMLEEAQGVYERMRVRHPEHPTVAQLGQRLRQAVTRPPDAVSQIPTATVEEIEASVRSVAPPAAPKPAAAAAPAEPSLEGVTPKFSVTDTAAPPSGGFVDLGAELEEEMAAVEQQGGAHAGTTPLVDGLIREFQKGVREQLDEKDFETHYNLGIAYKEMELYDEAIQEFQLTARDPARLLECADLMGLCYLAKGQPDQAVRSLSAGLEVEGHPPASYHSLHYDLGVAYEALGELQKSLAQFELLQQQGAQFRDVQVRVQGLRARLPKATGAAPPDGPKTPRKKKISFI